MRVQLCMCAYKWNLISRNAFWRPRKNWSCLCEADGFPFITFSIFSSFPYVRTHTHSDTHTHTHTHTHTPTHTHALTHTCTHTHTHVHSHMHKRNTNILLPFNQLVN